MSSPQIVFIDDHEEELNPLAELVSQLGNASSQVLLPSDIDEDSLKASDLVVVDITLDDWIDNVAVDQISLRPPNGIALAAVLRQHALRLREFPPTAFALITGKVDLLGPIPSERRPHVISRLNNVEWFFDKGKAKAAGNVEQIISLAQAVSTLPESVGQNLGTLDALIDFLGVGSHPLSDRFKDTVQRCRPPIHHLAERSHGLVILRWLLHRILPHTTFLIDTVHLAARLGVTSDSLSAVVASNSRLEELLASAKYTGPLRDFDGVRWWRDGVEQWLWDMTRGNSANVEAVRGVLEQEGVAGLEPSGVKRPVVTFDEKLERETQFSSLADVLPVHLDDWPSYAEPAYMRKELLKEHDELRMYVAEDE